MRHIIYLFFACLLAGHTVAQTRDTVYHRSFQLTFVPPVGTNGMQAWHTVNKTSFNVLGGISRGVNGAELGALFNIVRSDVKGAQLAGFTNVTLQKVRGVQMAGFVNYSGGMQGAAFSGLCHVNMDSLKGGQFSGLANYNHGPAIGTQAAGFCNVNSASLKGTQLAGLANVCAGPVKGAQIAGFTNVAAGDMSGTQISGFFNYAKKVKGLQLSFINVADTVDGAAVAFFSFVKKGIHQVEISGDDMFYTNISVRTGMPAFYNIFTTGITASSGTALWHVGYGVGTSFGIAPRMRSDLSLSGQHVSKGSFYEVTSELFKLYWGVEYRFNKKVALACGPTFNLYMSDALVLLNSSTYNDIVPYHSFDFTTDNDFNFKGWVGGKLCLRFF